LKGDLHFYSGEDVEFEMVDVSDANPAEPFFCFEAVKIGKKFFELREVFFLADVIDGV